MRKPSEQFRLAILCSLERLSSTGLKFTRAEVVGGARFPDGAPVGRSTLYRKDKLGAFVHADLLRLLDESVPSKDIGKSAPRRSDESEMVELRTENTYLLDRVVTLEQERVALESTVRRAAAIERLLEVEKYVLAKLLSDLDPELILSRRTVSDFERKYEGRQELGDAMVIIDEWASSMK